MKNWSLSKKIWGVLGILMVAYVGTTYMSLINMTKIDSALEEITGSFVRSDQLTSEIKDNQRRISILTLESILNEEDSVLKKNNEDYKLVIDKQEKDIAEYEKLANEQGKALLKKYETAYDIFIEGNNKVRVLALDNKNDEATKEFMVLESKRAEMREHLNAMNERTASRLKNVSEEANNAAERAIYMSIITAIASILIASIIAFFVLRAVTNSINAIVKSLFDSSVQVSSASTQIASSSEELSQAATEQAASLEQTAASIEEMNSMVAKNSENASSTSSTSSKSQQKANEGKEVVEKMIQSMDAINTSNNTIMDQVNRSNESMAGIVKVIEEIGTKTKVINDIVFQTKLLSFNASVEAARAGEHGKGFAVVAEEVGNLAQMSGNAAKEISAMLEDSIRKVNQIVTETKSSVEKLIEDGKEAVETGSTVARQCGEVLDEIVQNVGSVTNMAGEIASASQEQSRGVAEITKAMGQLDQMTQQNAAVSEESASAAEELSAQADTLKNAVEQLVFTINGRSSGHQASAPAPAPAAKVHKAAPAKSTHKSSPQNVVHLKKSSKAHLQETAAAPAMKKASGSDVPDYNSDGFEDI